MKLKHKRDIDAHIRIVEEEDGRLEMYVEVDGKRVAKRAQPDSPRARTWISLEAGWVVRDHNYPQASRSSSVPQSCNEHGDDWGRGCLFNWPTYSARGAASKARHDEMRCASTLATEMNWEKIGDVTQTLFQCWHQNTRIVWTEFANDGSRYQRPQLRNYCDDCGRLAGSALKHSLATDVTARLTLEEATRPERLWREFAERRDAEQQRQQEEWHAWYESYLPSSDWDDKRRLVLKRAKGICEGCGLVPAIEVHHLTYKNCGKEFLWELVAVCGQCHRNVHGIEADNG